MYKKNVLAANGVGSSMVISGNCDILVLGLTTGSIKLQALFPGDADYVDLPDGSYTTDTFTTIFVSEDSVKMRLVGVSNNAGVIVRLGRYMND